MGATSSTILSFDECIDQIYKESQEKIKESDVLSFIFFNKLLDFDYIQKRMPFDRLHILRDEKPENLKFVIRKAIEILNEAVQMGENDVKVKSDGITNAILILTRLMPILLEKPEWDKFFWTSQNDTSNTLYAETMLSAISELLFLQCYTVEKLANINPYETTKRKVESFELIWANGIGFANPVTQYAVFDNRRAILLRLLLVCFSRDLYCKAQVFVAREDVNMWITYFVSKENKNILPLFTSLINVISSYDPLDKFPYGYLVVDDCRGPLVSVCIHMLNLLLDFDDIKGSLKLKLNDTNQQNTNVSESSNLFVTYASRLHNNEDFMYIVHGIARLMRVKNASTYLPVSILTLDNNQELLILLWKFITINKRFMYHLLGSQYLLNILVSILHILQLYPINQEMIGLTHICSFILLILSGERNFGVRLNKMFISRITFDIPTFTGNYADLMIIVIHKLITHGIAALKPLFGSFLTILLNISPYIKRICVESSVKLLHLIECFSTSWFLFENDTNYTLVTTLLEIINNIIQYQFDGNAVLMYTIIKKRYIFQNLNSIDSDIHFTYPLKTEEFDIPNTPAVAAKFEKNFKPANFDKSEFENKLKKHDEKIEEELKDVEILNSDTDNDGEIDDDSSVTKQKIEISQIEIQNSSNIIVNSKESESNIDAFSNLNITNVEEMEMRVKFKKVFKLETILRLLQVLVPQVESICKNKNFTEEKEVIEFLKRGTLVGLLPVPHPIVMRIYQPQKHTLLWLNIFIWATIFSKIRKPVLWNHEEIKLFKVIIMKC